MQYTLKQIRQAGKEAELKDNVVEHLISVLSNIDQEKKLLSPEERFLEIINGLEIKIDKKKYPDSIFYFKGDKYFFELEKDIIYCSYNNVWSIFLQEYKMNYDATQAFIKNQVEEHFKMKHVTPFSIHPTIGF
jgi:hypothetical protein